MAKMTVTTINADGSRTTTVHELPDDWQERAEAERLATYPPRGTALTIPEILEMLAAQDAEPETEENRFRTIGAWVTHCPGCSGELMERPFETAAFLRRCGRCGGFVGICSNWRSLASHLPMQPARRPRGESHYFDVLYGDPEGHQGYRRTHGYLTRAGVHQWG